MIDLLFTNKADRIVKTYNFLTGLSDHNLVLFARKLTKKRFMATPKTPALGSRFIPKNLQQRFMEAVKMINWGDTLSSEDIGENSNLFISQINDTMSSFSRRGCLRDRKERHLPWLNLQCRNLMKSREQLLKQSLKSGLSTDGQKFTHVQTGQSELLHQYN